MERALISKPPPPHPSPPAGDRRGCLSKANKQIPREHLNEPGPGTTQLKNGSYWLFFCDGGNNPCSKRVYSEGAPRGLFAARYCCQKPNKSSAEGGGGREVIKKTPKNIHRCLLSALGGSVQRDPAMPKRRCPGLPTHFRFLFLNVAIFNDVIRSNPCFPGWASSGDSRRLCYSCDRGAGEATTRGWSSFVGTNDFAVAPALSAPRRGWQQPRRQSRAMFWRDT